MDPKPWFTNKGQKINPFFTHNLENDMKINMLCANPTEQLHANTEANSYNAIARDLKVKLLH